MMKDVTVVEPTREAEISRQLLSVLERIAAAEKRAGREPGSVRLLPVTKTYPAADIASAMKFSGINTFAENRVQELVQKRSELADTPIIWSLIGHLQSNKSALAAANADEFQALDSLKLAALLDNKLQALGKALPVYIEVNSSGEPQKSGIDPSFVPSFAQELAEYPTLEVRGLMTVARASEDQREVAACFEIMRSLQSELRRKKMLGVPWNDLSMGMSNDFELAIEYGATVVRVGSAIFGQRS